MEREIRDCNPADGRGEPLDACPRTFTRHIDCAASPRRAAGAPEPAPHSGGHGPGGLAPGEAA